MSTRNLFGGSFRVPRSDAADHEPNAELLKSNVTNTTAPTPTKSIPLPPDKQGWLFKRGEVNSSWKKRWFKLNYQTLKYFKNSSDMRSKGSIPLAGSVVRYGSTDKLRKKFGFEIACSGVSRVYVIHANDEKDMNEWMRAIEKNVSYLAATQPTSEKKANNLSAALAETKKLFTIHQRSQSFARKLAHETRLDLDVDETDWMQKSGVATKFSLWRRAISLRGIQQDFASQKRLRPVSALDPDDRFPHPSVYCSHSSSNHILAGGSLASDLSSKGAIQILSVTHDNDLESSFHTWQRFGDVTSGLNLEDISKVSGIDEFHLPRCEGEVIDAAWQDSNVLLASSGGIARLYKLDPNDFSSSSSSSATATANKAMSSFSPLQTYIHAKSLSLPAAAPGKYSSSARIRRVVFSPVDKKTFLSLSHNLLYVWDVDHGDKPLHVELGSVQPLYAAAFSPFDAQYLAFGGDEGFLRTIDLRILASQPSKCITFDVLNAHSAPIRDVAYSPFVQYWLATASDDGTIKLWDTRYGVEPVRTFSSCTSSVFKICWSRAHCEVLLSASHDQTLRLWNARLSPHYLMHTYSDFLSPLLGCAFSSTHPFIHYGFGVEGDVRALHQHRDAVSAYVHHRVKAAHYEPKDGKATQAAGVGLASNGGNGDDAAEEESEDEDMNEHKENGAADDEKAASKDSNSLPRLTDPVTGNRTAAADRAERDIERLLYLRDFDQSFMAIADLANRYWDENCPEHASALLKLTSPSLFNQAATNDIYTQSSDPRAAGSSGALVQKKSFSSLLLELCRYLPPTTLRLSPVRSEAHTKIQFLKLRIALMKYLAAGKWEDIVALEKEICLQLERYSTSTNTAAAAGAPNSSAQPNSANTSAASSSTTNPAIGSAPAASSDNFDASTLERLVACVVLHDHIRAIEFAGSIAKTLKEAGNFQIFAPVAKLLFSPTIFDRIDYEKKKNVDDNDQPDQETEESVERRLKQITPSKPENDAREDSITSREKLGASAPTPRNLPALVTQASISRSPALSAASTPATPLMMSTPSVSGSASSSSATETSHVIITALERDFRNPKLVIGQLQLLLRVFSFVDGRDEDKAHTPSDAKKSAPSSSSSSPEDEHGDKWNPYKTLEMPALKNERAERIVKLMEDGSYREHRKILPIIIHRLFYASHLQLKRYDLLFICATHLADSLRSYPFFHYLMAFLIDHALPKFTKFVDSSVKQDKLSKHIAASLTIIHMLCSSKFLPDKVLSILPPYLTALTNALNSSLNELARKPKASPGSAATTGKQEAKEKAEYILSNIARIKNKMAEDGYLSEFITAFVNMVRGYAST